MTRYVTAFAPVTFAVLLAGASTLGAAAPSEGPLAIDSARVVINGSSNIHDYTAETRAVRLVNVKVATSPASPAFWADVVKPGELQAFGIALRADSLRSTKGDLDKNMHKALKAEQHPEIAFSLSRLTTTAAGATKAVGVLRVAGVEREVTLDLTFARRDDLLVVTGQTQFLMTDFGIAPPKAMLGMLKTDPKVRISFETVLSATR